MYAHHIPGATICPGLLAPEPPFQQRGEALGIHVGRVGAALGETLWGGEGAAPWSRVMTQVAPGSSDSPCPL